MNSRENNFNIIRFLCAVFVINGHMYVLLGQPLFYVYGNYISSLAVESLFIISGYLIYKSYKNDPHIGRYLLKRISRIMPGLIVMVLISIFIVGPIFTKYSTKEYFNSPITWNYLKNLVFNCQYNLPGVFDDNIYPYCVNGVIWTLPVEFFMYLVLPCILFIFRGEKIEKVGIVAIFLITFSLKQVTSIFYPSLSIVIWGTDWVDALSVIPYFFVGVIFAFPKVEKILNLQIATILMVITASLNLNYNNFDNLLIFILPYFVFSFAFCPKPIFKNFFFKNDYSYGIYLYGFLIQQILVNLLVGKIDLSVNVFIILSLLVTFIFAFISWHLVEKPIQKLVKKITQKSETTC